MLLLGLGYSLGLAGSSSTSRQTSLGPDKEPLLINEALVVDVKNHCKSAMEDEVLLHSIPLLFPPNLLVPLLSDYQSSILRHY